MGRAGFVAAVAVIVALALNQISAAQSLTAAGTGKITGRLLLPEGSPAVGLRVAVMTAELASQDSPGASSSICDSRDLLLSIGQTDRDGRYSLEGIPPGRYYLVARPLDAPAYFPGVLTKADATLINVTPGGTLADRDFRLPAPFTVRISGRVIREGHQEGTRVALRGGSPSDIFAPIAADGSFEFPAVGPGCHQVSVISNQAATMVSVPLSVADKHITGLEIPLPASAVRDVTIRFRLSVEGGGPLPRFSLLIKPAGNPGGNSEGLLDEQGRLRNGLPVPVIPDDSMAVFSFPIGEYEVSLPPSNYLSQIPAGYSIKSIASGSTDLQKNTLRLMSGTPPIAVTLAVASPPPWVKVSGRVTGIDKSSVRAERITIDGPLASPLSAALGPDGSFEFPALLPGNYRVTLTPSADPFVRQLVVSNADLSDVEIPMAIPMLKVSRRVSDVQVNAPDRQINVWLQNPWAGGAPRILISVVAAADGSFVIRPVEPGNYILNVRTCAVDVCLSTGVELTLTDRDITDLAVPFPDMPSPAPPF